MNWEFELIAGPYGGVSEGPVWLGEKLIFTHIPSSTIRQYTPATGEISIVKEHTNYANGLTLDHDNNLYACEGDARRVVKYAKNETHILADNYEGVSLNIPNDLVCDKDDDIWFTDPFYEAAAGKWSEDNSNKELTHDSVYRLTKPDNSKWQITRVTFDTTRPNGLLFSLNYDYLYVAQSGRREDEYRQLRTYKVNPDKSLGDSEVLHDFGPDRGIDGMCLDINGNIVATAGWELGGPGPMIYVFSPKGDILDSHPVPANRPTNCAFGGDKMSTLYITTTDGHLFKVETELTGINITR
ncbi:MAG: SMP-30/gluconolactonase/LRE family protein [SAR202 cluster bacterium]|nr:SMP-30/gluconolactonase/LRE family protein [SAR202 cluster bacterium]|tara:strand:- start:1950 stop:2843 length:894 start_codon:yes stop_codon:yes gene_type:complete